MENLINQSAELIKKYDAIIADGVKDLTDEQIDEVIWSQSDMSELLDGLVLRRKINTERRLIATKEEEKCDKFIYRIMERLGLELHESKDGKVSRSVQRRFETDLTLLPDEYKMAVWAKIHSMVSKKIAVPWVTPLEWHHKYSVR